MARKRKVKRRVRSSAPKRRTRVPVRKKKRTAFKRTAPRRTAPKRLKKTRRKASTLPKLAPRPKTRGQSPGRRANASAAAAASLSRRMSRLFGKASKTAERIREASAKARTEAKLAVAARNPREKARHARAAAAALDTARATAYHASQTGHVPETVRRLPRGGEWTPLQSALGPSTGQRFTEVDQRYSASAVLSYLEARPGIIGVTSWRPLSPVARVSEPHLSAEVRARAEAVERRLDMSAQEREDFEAMLDAAEEFGIELEVDVEGYGETIS